MRVGVALAGDASGGTRDEVGGLGMHAIELQLTVLVVRLGEELIGGVHVDDALQTAVDALDLAHAMRAIPRGFATREQFSDPRRK
jgi:hypothetical protein